MSELFYCPGCQNFIGFGTEQNPPKCLYCIAKTAVTNPD